MAKIKSVQIFGPALVSFTNFDELFGDDIS